MTPQVDALEVIDALAAEIATLTRRTVIAETRAGRAERRVADLEASLGTTNTKESK